MTDRQPEEPDEDWGSAQTPWSAPSQPSAPPPAAPPPSAPSGPPPYAPSGPPPYPAYPEPPAPQWQPAPGSGAQWQPPPAQPAPGPWQQPSAPPPPWNPAAPSPVRNYLVPAIVATVLCCIPAGIVAIVYSSQSQTKLKAGDVRGAVKASESARLWLIISVVAGVVVAGGYLVAVASQSGSTG